MAVWPVLSTLHRAIFATLLAARFGLGGVLNADLRNLLCVPVPPALVAEVALTPGSAIGSSRARITDEDFSRMAEELRRREIRVVFYTGGNGSMQTALSLLRHARAADLDLQGRRSRG